MYSKVIQLHSNSFPKSHGRRSLEGCSPWGRWGLDTTERLHFHFSFSFIGEGNGNPLQCSCLENPRGWGAWWAAVYGVAQSRTRLKRLSSSSGNIYNTGNTTENKAIVVNMNVEFVWMSKISPTKTIRKGCLKENINSLRSRNCKCNALLWKQLKAFSVYMSLYIDYIELSKHIFILIK